MLHEFPLFIAFRNRLAGESDVGNFSRCLNKNFLEVPSLRPGYLFESILNSTEVERGDT
jgi:hypothetical protein